MSHHRPIVVMLALPPVDFHSYVRAARILTRIMGAAAPDVAALMSHELHRRRPRSIAAEYLYFVGWPAAPANRRARRKPSGPKRVAG